MATLIERLLGSPFVSRIASTTTAGRLRVLAYHDVPDRSAFAAQLDILERQYVVVSGTQVASALGNHGKLPDRAVWITFDDGVPDVISNGLPELSSRGMVATAFLCPGVIRSQQRHWWQIMADGIPPRVSAQYPHLPTDPRAAVSWLKEVPDSARREIIDSVLQCAEAMAGPSTSRQLSVDEVGAWLSAGNEIGNHTLDHPLLDRCSTAEGIRQIVEAHELLVTMFGVHPTSFAWPNGNRRVDLLEVLRQLRYQLVANFDHSLCPSEVDPFDIPRLRVDTAAPRARFTAIVSGAHSGIFGMRRRIRRR